MRGLGLGISLLAALGGCVVDTEVPEGAVIACGSSKECPQGDECQDGFCVPEGTNGRPSVTLGPIDRSVDGVDIPVTVIDAEANTVRLAVEADLGAGFEALELGLSSFTSSPEGVPHTITWAASGTLDPNLFHSGLRVRVTPSDASGTGLRVISDPYDFGNTPPELESLSIEGNEGLVIVRFEAADLSSDPVQVTGFVVSLAGDFSDAIDVPVSGPAAPFPVGALVEIETSEAGLSHTLVWDSVQHADVDASAARLRLTIADDFASTTLESASFALDNATSRPVLHDVVGPTVLAPGIIEFSYGVSDLDGDPSIVTVDYGIVPEGELEAESFQPASSSSDTVGLAPGTYDFVWQATQLGFETYEVQLRFSIVDADDDGEPVFTAPFFVDNRLASGNQQPAVSVSTPTKVIGRYLDTVLLPVVLSDPNGAAEPPDVVDVTVRYFVGSCPLVQEFPPSCVVPPVSSWPVATIDGDTTQLTADPGGTYQVFGWDALADGMLDGPCDGEDTNGDGLTCVTVDNDGDGIPETEVAALRDHAGYPLPGVVLAVEARDSQLASAPVVMTSPFAIGNDTPEVVSVEATAGSGEIAIELVLSDPMSDLAAIEVWFRCTQAVCLQPLPDWRPAHITRGAKAGLDTSDLAIEHVIVWKSDSALSDDPLAADQGIGHRTLHGIELQVRASDGPWSSLPDDRHYGSPLVSSSFKVENQTTPRVEVVFVKNEGAVRTGAVPIVYRLLDEQSEPVDLRIEFSVDGVNWATAAEYYSPYSEGRYHLATAPAALGAGGIEHTFIWDASANFFEKSPGARLRFVPKDGAEGPPVEVLPAGSVGPPGATPNDSPFSPAATTSSVGTKPRTVVAGDLDSDGDLDLVVSTCGPDNTQTCISGDADQVLVLLNNGAGGFGVPAALASVGNGPRSLALGRFDSGNTLDLAVVNEFSNTVSIYLGNGAGGFTQATGSPITVDSAPQSIVLGLFNADPELDFAVTHKGSNFIRVFTGDGDGTFTAGTPLDLGMESQALVVANVDGDPWPDLVATVYPDGAGDVAVAYGTGTGGFTLAPESPVNIGLHANFVATHRWLSAADLDGDGVVDLALTVYPAAEMVLAFGGIDDTGGWDGTFEPVVYPIGNGGASRLGDVNNDGLVDVVRLGSTSNFQQLDDVTVILGVGAIGLHSGRPAIGPSYSVFAGATDLLVADLNGDAALDLLTVNSLNNLLSTRLSRSLAPPELGAFFAAGYHTVANPSDATTATVADFDDDGRTDVAFFTQEGLGVLRGRGSVGIGASSFDEVSINFGTYPAGTPALADLDADGCLDIAYAEWNSPESVVVRRRPKGLDGVCPPSFGAGTAYPMATLPVNVAALDFNTDGVIDLVAEHRNFDNPATLTFLRGTGGGNFATAGNVTIGVRPQQIAIGDLNGDARPDVVVAHSGVASGSVHVLLNGTGTGALTAVFNPASGTPLTSSLANPRSVNLADLNADGILDLVVADEVKVTVYHGLGGAGIGAGTFASTPPGFMQYTVGLSARQVSIGDFTDDGTLDLVASGNLSDGARLLVGQNASGLPNGQFTAVAVDHLVGPPIILNSSSGDFNGDGMLDVVTGHYGTPGFGMLTTRREAFRGSWQVVPSNWTGYSGNVFGPGVLPTEPDAFGQPQLASFSQRYFHGDGDEGSLHAPRTNGDFRNVLRAYAETSTVGIAPMTPAMTALGDVRLTRVNDPTGSRLKVEARFGPLVDPDGPGFDRFGLDVDLPDPDVQRGLIIDLPIPTGITAQQIADGAPVVFARYLDWVRASEVPGDPMYGQPGAEAYLPRVQDVTGEYRDVVNVYSVFDTLEADDNGFDSGTETGGRFVIETSPTRRMRVLTDRLGTFQGFLYPP